jgi:NAD(P)-dependent dehydrogenase (short-subunit alcohol dehydrogenase family)
LAFGSNSAVAEADFKDMAVVITGSERGLGFGVARRFGQAGARVVVAGQDAGAGANAVSVLRAEGLSASFEPVDVREPAQSLRLVKKVTAERGKIDVWVNNAGVLHTSSAETHPREWWGETLSMNLSGAFYCSQAVGRHMLARGQGVIVNVAAADGYRPIEGRVAYSVAQAGLIMLTQALGVEWAGRGVRVVGIAPGAVTDENAPIDIVTSPQAYERRTPLGRLGTVEEVAEAVLFLAGNEASYLTAETMRVDGGWVAYQLF